MPWFCASRPKKNKNKNKNKNKTTPTTYATHDNVSGFVVVRQSQDPQAPDDLPVTRGQVVEVLYTNNEWIYVKDVDGQCGYVPRDFCLPVEHLEQIQSVRTAGTLIPRPKPRQRPRTLNLQSPQSSLAGQATTTTTAAVQTHDAGHKHLTGSKSMQRSVGGGGANRPTDTASNVDSGTLESNTTTTTANSTASTQCCPTLFRFGGTKVEPLDGGEASSSKGANLVRAPHDGTAPVAQATPPARRALHRATSYQEAVITADQKLYGLTAGIRPTYLHLPHRHQHGEEGDGCSSHQGTLEHNYETLESNKSAATPYTVDVFSPRDVFHFEERKPQGIFISEVEHRARLQGEVSLHRGEMVVVTDYGQGEWAWVMSASNQEGAVPKSILSRYLGDPMTTIRSSDAGTGKVSTGTQTELMVSSAVVRESGAGPAPTLTSKSHHNSMSMRYSVVVGAQATSSFASQQSACYTPNDTSSGYMDGPEWFRSSELLSNGRAPPPQASYQTPPPQSVHQPETPCSTLERRFEGQRAANGVDFEPEYDTISCISEQRKVKQTPILIALRDCNPPPSTKNTLVIRKGDVLHHQPQEHYPNGWMWVYHTGYKRYGYVPKTHVAYMYVVQKKQRKDRSSNEESV